MPKSTSCEDEGLAGALAKALAARAGALKGSTYHLCCFGVAAYNRSTDRIHVLMDLIHIDGEVFFHIQLATLWAVEV